MRLIKGSRLWPLIWLFVACTHVSEHELLQGSWKYESIVSGDSMLVIPGDDDILKLNKDSSFVYDIAGLNLHKHGVWDYKNHILTLRYSDPEAVRYFQATLLSKRRLILEEGKMRFRFSKND